MIISVLLRSMLLCKFRSWMLSSSLSEVRFVVFALGRDIKARYFETTTVKGADQDRREALSLIRFCCVYWTVNQAESPKPRTGCSNLSPLLCIAALLALPASPPLEPEHRSAPCTSQWSARFEFGLSVWSREIASKGPAPKPDAPT